MKPLLSIVVPTKDRYKYLKHLISLIESFKSKDIELVIQDNTKVNHEMLEFLSKKEYSFLKYFHIEEQLSVARNSDLAILNSSGEYVCYIGDDDGVTNYIVNCVQWMKENNVDALISSVIDYYWPDYINNRNMDASFFYKPFTKKANVVDTMEVLSDIMSKGFINKGNLPGVYQGIVKRDVLDKVYEIGETFFPGPSPDIANAVALCFVVTKYVRLDLPVVITGASIMNGGGIRKLKKQAAEIDNLPFLPKNAKEKWESNIPRIWAGETVWPESAIKALRYMGRSDLIQEVDFEYMLARFILFHFSLRKLATELSQNKLILYFKLSLMIFKRYYKGLIGLIDRKIFNKYNERLILHGQKDINQAQKTLMELEPVFEISNKI